VTRVVREVDALFAALGPVAFGARTGLTADFLDAFAATSGKAHQERERDESEDPHPEINTLTRRRVSGQKEGFCRAVRSSKPVR